MSRFYLLDVGDVILFSFTAKDLSVLVIFFNQHFTFQNEFSYKSPDTIIDYEFKDYRQNSLDKTILNLKGKLVKEVVADNRKLKLIEVPNNG